MSIEFKSTQDRKNTFINIIVYGASGVGKTSLTKTLPEESTLVLSAEDGLLSISDKNYAYVNVKSINDVMSIIKDPDAQKFKNIVVDSITELSQNHYQFLKKKHPDPKKALVLWGEFSSDFSNLFQELRRLQKNVLALALVKEVENEIGKLIKKPDVYGRSSDRIIAWFDECFYMFVNKEGNRKLLTQAQETVMAKDRSGKFEKTIDPDIGLVVQKILK